jgi:hypothetical protein
MKKSLAIAAAAILAAAAFADPKADQIVRRHFDLETPKDSRSIASMTIVDKSGGKKIRKLEMLSKEAAEGRNSFVRFLEPADVAGTKLLTLASKGGGSEQRLYLPALKKVRRIASGTKDGDFVGSDLSYYDMEEREFDDFSYSLLAENEGAGDESLAGLAFYKVEMKPKDAEAPYSRIVAWIDMSNYALRKSECYGRRDGALAKTIVFAKTDRVGGVLVNLETIVTSARRKSSTILKVSDLKVNEGIGDEAFSLKNLEK